MMMTDINYFKNFMKVFCLTSFLGGCYQCFKFPSKKFNNATMLEAHYYSEKKTKK